MSDTAKITLHQEILSDSSYVPSVTLKLSVSTVSGGISPCIFVHEYIPKNPNTVKAAYDFTNVAYYDELSTVKDYVSTRHATCLVRLSSICKSFPNRAELDSFLNTVLSDIQRLLTQLETQNTAGCNTLEVTSNSIVDSPCADIEADLPPADNAVVETSGGKSIVISFDGTVAN